MQDVLLFDRQLLFNPVFDLYEFVCWHVDNFFHFWLNFDSRKFKNRRAFLNLW